MTSETKRIATIIDEAYCNGHKIDVVALLEKVRAGGYREGVEKMREDAALECFKQMREATFNGAYMTMPQQKAAATCGHAVRAIPITPPQPEAKGDVREALAEVLRGELANCGVEIIEDQKNYVTTMILRSAAWQAACEWRDGK